MVDMKKIVLACTVIVAILILGIAMAEQGNFLTPTPTTTTASPSPSHIATPSPTPTTTPSSNPTLNPSIVPYDFSMRDLPTINITQGGYENIPIRLNTVSGDAKSINPHDVILSADSGSSDILCVFNSTTYDYMYPFYEISGESAPTNGFENTLKITVPSSTPANTYAITVTAKIGTVSHGISILVSVKSPPPTPTPIPNPIITVSGTFNASNLGITEPRLRFQITPAFETKNYYTTETEKGAYSIDLPNHSHYSVTIYNGTSPIGIELWLLVDPYFTVNVPAESSSMTKDFTVPIVH